MMCYYLNVQFQVQRVKDEREAKGISNQAVGYLQAHVICCLSDMVLFNPVNRCCS